MCKNPGVANTVLAVGERSGPQRSQEVECSDPSKMVTKSRAAVVVDVE
jgi:hypothetical protein